MDNLQVMNLLNVILLATLRMSTPLILTTIGATFSVRAGISELGCEGMMIAGAFFGVLGSYITGNAWLGMLFGVIFGVVFSLIHGVLHVIFKVNQTISGMGVNLLSAAIAPLLIKLVWHTNSITTNVDSFNSLENSFIKDIPFIGNFLSQQNIIFYMAIMIMVLSWLYLFRTKSGLRMRVVGENPTAASTIGINVVAYKLVGTMICGALSGLGGVFLSLGQLSQYVDGMTAGRGYIAMVINAFGRYSPIGATVGSLFFGFFDALQIIFQSSAIPSQFLMMLPYAITLVVLTIGLKRTRLPAGVGKHHDL
ncbi:MAG: ABC transporter permease [Bacillota bacterium]